MRRSPKPCHMAGAAVLSVLLAACGGTAPTGTPGATAYTLSAGTPPPKGDIASFTWALYAEPPGLDYIHAFDYPQNMILANVCESLMRWTPELTMEPGLATKVTNPDAKTFVYTIRPGVKFHGGGEMTADDVVYSIRRHLDPALGSYWNKALDNVESVTKTGPMQVTVTLKRPDALFPQWMATSAGTVVSAKAAEAMGKRFGTADGGVDCTGPFTLGTWTKGQSIELDRFDGYWGKRAKAGKVTFRFIPDVATRTATMTTGETDGGYLITPDSYTRLESSGKGKLYFGKSLTTVSLSVTNLKGAVGDVRVRKALMLALDRQGFLKTGLGGVGTLSGAPAARDAWQGAPAATVDAAYEGLAPASRDVEQARRLIQEAGATGKKVVVATSPIGPDVSLLATAVQAAGTEIGLDVELKTIAPDAYTALFSDPTAREAVDLFPNTYYLSITDPLASYSVFRSGDFENYSGFSDPAYDALFDQATAEYDPAKRAELTARLQKMETEQALWIPVAEWPTTMFLNNRITGAPTTIAYMYYPWAADVGAAG
ncbi:ABC transporter substrate-binding protein [Microtetraspora fusca]|uniref:ABC transporter substrate-binding protein n=1 Tax=Microtetraspora fusca TaxID=1997 RepID=UPI000B2DBA38|nr:ABC transporter substrate-binding protein [Microtetraspora fusca]